MANKLFLRTKTGTAPHGTMRTHVRPGGGDKAKWAPKHVMRAAYALAKAADANERQKRDEATRRVEVLSHSRIEAMPERNRKQKRRKAEARRRFMDRIAAKGATVVSRAVTL